MLDPDPPSLLPARRMALDAVALTESAHALTAQVVERLRAGDAADGLPPTLPAIVPALLCELLRNMAEHPEGWGALPLKGLRWDAGEVEAVILAMRDDLLLQRRKPCWHDGKPPPTGKARRLRARLPLLDLAADEGIAPAHWLYHFTLPPPPAPPPPREEMWLAPPPLQLKAARRSESGRLSVAEEMPVDPADPEVRTRAEELYRLEEYLRDQRLRPFGFAHLRRTFFRLPEGADQWRLGGRIAALGACSFQSASANRRAAMTINGAPVVEIDIAACGLTILHGLAGQAMPEGDEPYLFRDHPREVLKAIIVEAFGPQGLATCWTHDTAHGLGLSRYKLERLHPFGILHKHVLRRFPLLAQPVDWAAIQYTESSLLMATLNRLAFDHDVPALPVHDSIIVPARHADLASAVLTEEFTRTVGIPPRLRRSTDSAGDSILAG